MWILLLGQGFQDLAKMQRNDNAACFALCMNIMSASMVSEKMGVL